MFNIDIKVGVCCGFNLDWVPCEVFVVNVVSRIEWHIDVRRFLTILKKISEVNMWLTIDERRSMATCRSCHVITILIIYYRIYAIGN